MTTVFRAALAALTPRLEWEILPGRVALLLIVALLALAVLR